MKVLVTGGTGLLGTALVKRLIEQGYEVRTIDLKEPQVVPCEFIKGSITDPVVVKKAVDGCEVLFHTCALTPPLNPSLNDYFDVNVKGTAVVVETSIAAGIKRIVYTSSICATGHLPAPLPAGDSYPIDENCRRAPQEIYGLSKLFGEEIVSYYVSTNKGITGISLRAASFYPKPTIWEQAHFLLMGNVDLTDLVTAHILAGKVKLTGYRGPFEPPPYLMEAFKYHYSHSSQVCKYLWRGRNCVSSD